MAEHGEFRFEIANKTPLTLSMARLSAYLPHLVELFGHKEHIHLIRVDEGSAVPCVYTDDQHAPAVHRRLLKIKTGSGSRSAYKAMGELNELLTEDGTSAVLRAPYFSLAIEFPGIKQATETVVGPISEYADVQGELFQIGCRDETISLYIRSGKNVFICAATREQGRRIAEHLFRSVRVYGLGKWVRNESGHWKLLELVLDDFAPLSEVPLSKAIRDLRSLSESIPGERMEVEPG